jgi:hypothetical protein
LPDDELDTTDEPPDPPEDPPVLPEALSALSQALMARAPAANSIIERWAGLIGVLLCGGRCSLLVEQPQATHELVQENDFAMHQIRLSVGGATDSSQTERGIDR